MNQLQNVLANLVKKLVFQRQTRFDTSIVFFLKKSRKTMFLCVAHLRNRNWFCFEIISFFHFREMSACFEFFFIFHLSRHDPENFKSLGADDDRNPSDTVKIQFFHTPLSSYPIQFGGDDVQSRGGV